jgi:hypothetical protein
MCVCVINQQLLEQTKAMWVQVIYNGIKLQPKNTNIGKKESSVIIITSLALGTWIRNQKGHLVGKAKEYLPTSVPHTEQWQGVLFQKLIKKCPEYKEMSDEGKKWLFSQLQPKLTQPPQPKKTRKRKRGENEDTIDDQPVPLTGTEPNLFASSGSSNSSSGSSSSSSSNSSSGISRIERYFPTRFF